MKTSKKRLSRAVLWAGIAFLVQGNMQGLGAAPPPGGTLDPTTIPKYVTPLVIPPEMPASTVQPGAPAAEYNIAVRQFQQQILPGGIWNTLNGRADIFNPTTIWSYGLAEDPLPDSSGIPGGAPGVAPAPNSSFNYPAFTIETTSGLTTTVRWINDLVDPATGNYLPHLFPVDQTLHWANPPAINCMNGMNMTDCRTMNPDPYTGPVPLVTHVHGAHVNQESDGYPEAWWLPDANNIDPTYATRGGVYTQYDNTNAVPGSAYYGYENDQPATTLWYHDHALGMTRLNVYAGPAGFWMVRGGANSDDFADDTSTPAASDGVLPGPAPAAGAGDPNFDPAYRSIIREIPVVIQDRSFNADGSLFYPDNRAFFEGLNVEGTAGTPAEQFPGGGELRIPFIGDMLNPSDISGIWNPEAFFNTMVVNGSTWPQLNVSQDRYRFRLLNGCNSRFLNLAMFEVLDNGPDNLPGTGDETLGQEIPFYQIGAGQGFLPQVTMITTGFATPLPGNGTIPAPVAQADVQQALLMIPAERADVIVDFSNLADGTHIRMINTAPDAPFGGFPTAPLDPMADPPADPSTTGQVMEFIVTAGLNNTPGSTDGLTTAPENLLLPAEMPLGAEGNTRKVSLNEEESGEVCVTVLPDGSVEAIPGVVFDPADPAVFLNACTVAGGVPMAPKAALLGTLGPDPVTGIIASTPLLWMDAITEAPALGDTEVWEIHNLTMDAHPIHLHLVRFEVVNRQALDPVTLTPVGATTPPQPWETGYKDTVIAYPDQITRIKATFDRAGLYVWHCHILEHEDNEMMRPYAVRFVDDLNNDQCVNRNDLLILLGVIRGASPDSHSNTIYDLNGDGAVNIADARYLVSRFTNPRGGVCTPN